MVRTQIQLTEQQAQTLKAEAAARQISMAELIRRAVDHWLRTSARADYEERKRRALSFAGRFHAGLSDLAAHHDQYLAEDYGP